MLSLVPLIDISEYHADAEGAFRLYYSPSNPAYHARFVGYRPSEVTSELKERLSETERRSALAIIARIEAAFRVDYISRARSKDADPRSATFRRLYARKGDKVRLEDDILETWRHHLDPTGRAAISQLRGMLKYRHWLAHGRYWNPGTPQGFQDIYALADFILAEFDFQV